MARSILDEIEDDLMEDGSEEYGDSEEEEEEDWWSSSFEKEYEKGEKEED